MAGPGNLSFLGNAWPVMAQSGVRTFTTEILFNYGGNRGGIVALRFKIVVTVPGTFFIQYAPAVAVAGQTARINQGSFIVARQIA
jgi:hypothetical protein